MRRLWHWPPTLAATRLAAGLAPTRTVLAHHSGAMAAAHKKAAQNARSAGRRSRRGSCVRRPMPQASCPRATMRPASTQAATPARAVDGAVRQLRVGRQVQGQAAAGAPRSERALVQAGLPTPRWLAAICRRAHLQSCRGRRCCRHSLCRWRAHQRLLARYLPPKTGAGPAAAARRARRPRPAGRRRPPERAAAKVRAAQAAAGSRGRHRRCRPPRSAQRRPAAAPAATPLPSGLRRQRRQRAARRLGARPRAPGRAPAG